MPYGTVVGKVTRGNGKTAIPPVGDEERALDFVGPSLLGGAPRLRPLL